MVLLTFGIEQCGTIPRKPYSDVGIACVVPSQSIRLIPGPSALEGWLRFYFYEHCPENRPVETGLKLLGNPRRSLDDAKALRNLASFVATGKDPPGIELKYASYPVISKLVEAP
jgi:hypothetical protein